MRSILHSWTWTYHFHFQNILRVLWIYCPAKPAIYRCRFSIAPQPNSIKILVELLTGVNGRNLVGCRWRTSCSLTANTKCIRRPQAINRQIIQRLNIVSKMKKKTKKIENKKANARCYAFYLIKLRFSWDVAWSSIPYAWAWGGGGVCMNLAAENRTVCTMYIIKNRLQIREICRKTPRSF